MSTGYDSYPRADGQRLHSGLRCSCLSCAGGKSRQHARGRAVRGSYGWLLRLDHRPAYTFRITEGKAESDPSNVNQIAMLELRAFLRDRGEVDPGAGNRAFIQQAVGS